MNDYESLHIPVRGYANKWQERSPSLRSWTRGKWYGSDEIFFTCNKNSRIIYV